VKHRLLVRRLRGEGNRRFANAGFWFLTLDSSLPRYDSIARAGAAELPFCITNGVWLQVTRAFTPRTADFDQTLTDLMASPYVRYRGRIAYDTVREVVSRVELFSGATPDLAASVLFNTALLREVSHAQSAEKRAELIDNALVQAAADLEKQLEVAHAETEVERQSRMIEQDRVEALQDAIVRERTERMRLEDRLQQEHTAREESALEVLAQTQESRASSDYAMKKLERELTNANDALTNLRSAVIRWLKWGFGSIVMLITAAALGFLGVTGRLDSPLAIAIATGIACTGLGVGSALSSAGSEWASRPASLAWLLPQWPLHISSRTILTTIGRQKTLRVRRLVEHRPVA